MTRDPRFDELSGTFNQEKFDKAYSFLDQVKANEKKVRITCVTKLQVLCYDKYFSCHGGLYSISGSCKAIV